MSRLTWDERGYEVGVEKGVFYSPTGVGVAWNGLSSVDESPDSEDKTQYLDGVRQQQYRTAESFSGTIKAYTYPDEFYDDVLMQRRPKSFGFSYQVRTAESYKIHLVYNVLVQPTQNTYQYSEVDAFSWDFTTKPMYIPGARPSAHLVIDPTVAYDWTMQALEDVLYGSEAAAPRLPAPIDIFNIFEENSIVRVIDHGDGSFTVTGPDDVVQMIDATTFQIDWPSAVYIDSDTYTIHSL